MAWHASKRNHIWMVLIHIMPVNLWADSTFFLPYKLSLFLASVPRIKLNGAANFSEESELENFLEKVILSGIDKKDTIHYGRSHLS